MYRNIGIKNNFPNIEARFYIVKKLVFIGNEFEISQFTLLFELNSLITRNGI